MNMLKQLLLPGILLAGLNTAAQNTSLVKTWESDSTFKVPECVLYSPADNMLYVSNIDGKPSEKDLKGSISKVSPDGKTMIHNWAINLSAPKGMGIFGKTLFVADMQEVVLVDLNSGDIRERIVVPGSVFLNDVTVAPNGTVYVSDSYTGKVHQIKNSVQSTYMENKVSINGLYADGEDLYLAVKDTLYKADKNKMLTVIATGMDESSDGIEMTTNKDFIVSCWNGIVYHIKKDGSKTVLIDTREQKINAADIGFDKTKNMLYVPTFFNN
ncbi:MAG: ATP/GTP-binding protein, partial [Gloeobacteraceae cyanobacterium ES-bin-316]|nr:ATP/GTP-binding protein [Ferruginibacter sp.]